MPVPGDVRMSTENRSGGGQDSRPSSLDARHRRRPGSTQLPTVVSGGERLAALPVRFTSLARQVPGAEPVRGDRQPRRTAVQQLGQRHLRRVRDPDAGHQRPGTVPPLPADIRSRAAAGGSDRLSETPGGEDAAPLRYNLSPIAEADNVRIGIPDVDRSRDEHRNLICVVLEVRVRTIYLHLCLVKKTLKHDQVHSSTHFFCLLKGKRVIIL